MNDKELESLLRSAETCDVCGLVNHFATNQWCSCWIPVANLPLADVKAIFATDPTFNVETDGSLTLADRSE